MHVKFFLQVGDEISLDFRAWPSILPLIMFCPHLVTVQFDSGTWLRRDASRNGPNSGKNPTTSVRRKLEVSFLGIRQSAKTSLPFQPTTPCVSSITENLISSRRRHFPLRLVTTRSCRQLAGHSTESFCHRERRKGEFLFGRDRTRVWWPLYNRRDSMKSGNF